MQKTHKSWVHPSKTVLVSQNIETQWNLQNLILDILSNLGPCKLFRKHRVVFQERFLANCPVALKAKSEAQNNALNLHFIRKLHLP